MTEGKHIFDAAMNKEKSNTDKVIEILNSFEPDSITVYYDADYHSPLHWRILRVVLIGGLVAGLASWLARRRG